MNLIEIADNEYINVDKYFAFELSSNGKGGNDVTATVVYSVCPVTMHYKSGLALRDYLLSPSRKQEWVYIRTCTREVILNTEHISKLEFEDGFWYVETGENVRLQNCSGMKLGFDEDGVKVLPDHNHMKPTSFMKIKAALNPLDISVED